MFITTNLYNFIVFTINYLIIYLQNLSFKFVFYIQLKYSIHTTIKIQNIKLRFFKSIFILVFMIIN